MNNFNQIAMFLMLTVSAAVAEKQLFSPRYLETHGNIDPNCQYISTDDSIQCTSYSSDYRRLVSVPLGAFLDHVVADITIGVNPKLGNIQDNDFVVALSDGSKAIGFWIVDVKNYNSYEPCTHVQGTAGKSLTDLKVLHYGPLISKENAYPQSYNFLISTRQQSGACITATQNEGAYTTAGYYNASLEVGSQLTLDIYGDRDSGEIYNFRYFAVDVHVGL